MSLRLTNGATATSSVPTNVFASGTITAVAGSALIDGETFTLQNRRGVRVRFEFDSNSSFTAGNVPVVFTAGDTSTTVATAIAAAISGVASLGLASVGAVATVTNTARRSGPDWNAAGTDTVANGTFAVTDVTGGFLDGFKLQGHSPGDAGYWLKPWDMGVIHVKGVGTGALTFQGIVYLYSTLTDAWEPAGISSTIGNRGMLNDGTTITGTTSLAHTQPISALSAYDRIALQITTISGTGNAVTAYLSPRAEG